MHRSVGGTNAPTVGVYAEHQQLNIVGRIVGTGKGHGHRQPLSFGGIQMFQVYGQYLNETLGAHFRGKQIVKGADKHPVGRQVVIVYFFGNFIVSQVAAKIFQFCRNQIGRTGKFYFHFGAVFRKSGPGGDGFVGSWHRKNAPIWQPHYVHQSAVGLNLKPFDALSHTGIQRLLLRPDHIVVVVAHIAFSVLFDDVSMLFGGQFATFVF